MRECIGVRVYGLGFRGVGNKGIYCGHIGIMRKKWKLPHYTRVYTGVETGVI